MPLFIGGPADGQNVKIEHELPYVDIDVLGSRERFRYKKEKIASNTRVYEIYIPSSYTCDDVIASLLKGYKNST